MMIAQFILYLALMIVLALAFCLMLTGLLSLYIFFAMKLKAFIKHLTIEEVVNVLKSLNRIEYNIFCGFNNIEPKLSIEDFSKKLMSKKHREIKYDIFISTCFLIVMIVIPISFLYSYKDIPINDDEKYYLTLFIASIVAIFFIYSIIRFVIIIIKIIRL